jgi:putative oxidoreductase
MIKLIRTLLNWINRSGQWLGFLGLRILLGWEFFESGREKFQGENWFADIQDKFPTPFNLMPVNISWSMATWFELIGGVALVIGLGTRFFAAALFVLTIVAIAAVHWPAAWHTLGELAQGYAITDDGHGNFKLPVIFLAMLLPLILSGPGKLSLDAWIARRYLGKA